MREAFCTAASSVLPIMKRYLIIAALMATFVPVRLDAQPQNIDYAPSATYFFGQRDTVELYLAVYEPAPESETTFEGRQKPTILWLFVSVSTPDFISLPIPVQGVLP